MTGFGAGSFEAEGASYRVELKSVNHRGLNVRFHLPAELEPFEAEAQRRLRAVLGRGSVSVGVHRERAGCDAMEVSIDAEAISAVWRALAETARDLGTEAPTLETALRYTQDAVQVSVGRVEPDALGPAFLAGLDQAAAALDQARAEEGRALTDDLVARLATLGQLLDRLEAVAPKVMERYGQRLRQRLDDAAAREGLELDPGRVATELVVYSDRSDVTEEVVRARTHLARFEGLVRGGGDGEAAPGPLGKRLDFLCQELGREFNTVGSKCRDAGMADAVVDAKVELERIREQIQNIA